LDFPSRPHEQHQWQGLRDERYHAHEALEDLAAARVLLCSGPHKIFAVGLDQSALHSVCSLVIVPRHAFPYLGEPQKRESLQYDYRLFFSNFNGTWNQYIDAFSAVLSRGLNLIWRWSEKYPGSVPVTPFKSYITSVQFDSDYFFSAYPEATINDVQSAHIVQSELDSLSKRAEALTAEEFRAAYLQFVLKVQAHLGSTGTAPEVF
jgi:hypothetical protein